MPKIEGKTINELLRVNDITGSEIIPMSVFNQKTGGYVTRGITLDDFFKTIYNRLQEADDNITYVSERVVELQKTDEALHKRDDELNAQLTYTNSYVSYNAEGIVKLHNDLHNVVAYTYNNVANVTNIMNSYAEAISYNSYVNKVQSGRINTLYYENSNDAFDDWENTDDDYVTPQE